MWLFKCRLMCRAPAHDVVNIKAHQRCHQEVIDSLSYAQVPPPFPRMHSPPTRLHNFVLGGKDHKYGGLGGERSGNVGRHWDSEIEDGGRAFVPKIMLTFCPWGGLSSSCKGSPPSTCLPKCACIVFLGRTEKPLLYKRFGKCTEENVILVLLKQ